MINPDCKICRGIGRVWLPVYHSVEVISAPFVMPDRVEEAYREYACPECGEQISFERVAVVQMHSYISSEIKEPGFKEYAERSIRAQLTHKLADSKFIALEQGDIDNIHFRFALRATIGVVSPEHVATLEDRVASRQMEVAKEVVAEAHKEISNWGSFYGHSDILKRDAGYCLDQAFKSITDKHAKVS